MIEVSESTILPLATSTYIFNETTEEDLRQQATRDGKEAAATWLHDQCRTIRQEQAEKFQDLLIELHSKCLVRIQEGISRGETAGLELCDRMIGQMSRTMSTLIDELVEQRVEFEARDSITVAFAMYTDTREQAMISYFRSLRSRILQAKARSLVIESEIAARRLIELRGGQPV
jgi:hypothetical protein